MDTVVLFDMPMSVMTSLAMFVQIALNAPAETGRGLAGPILLILVIALLNVGMIAFAFRLRRYLNELGERREEE